MRRLLNALVCTAALSGAPAISHAAQPDRDHPADLAAQAAHLVADERALLRTLDADRGSAEQLAALSAIDAAGAAMLARLEAAGAPFGASTRTVLGVIAQGAGGPNVDAAPAEAVYRAAFDELLEIAAGRVPDRTAVAPRGVSYELLVIVALSFVGLGMTALLFTVRSARPRRELRALAWSDSLTGVANRRRLDRDIGELVHSEGSSRGRRPAGPTAVIMVDIDHFKEINDFHGHGFGDDVLRAVGAMLAGAVRHDDVVYRYGGEEFCIVLRNATDAEAVAVAQRVLAAARQLEFPGGVRVTLSAGFADGPGGEIDRTLAAADQALLAAKRAGRDRAEAAQ